MNKLVLLCLLLSAGTYFSFAFSQNEINKDVSLSPLTVVMIKNHYSADDIRELSKNINKLKAMEYLFANSFEVAPNQEFTKDQLLKIDILNYRLDRKLDEIVTVFDEKSGLTLVLYSIKTIDEAKKIIYHSANMSEGQKTKSVN